jgi:histidyl-tRNA synthetase
MMGELEVSSILIVEGKSDKVILESLIKSMNITNDEINSSVCTVDKYEVLDGMGELEKKLISLKRDIRKNSIRNIGIIFDADKVGVEKRTEEIKTAIQNVFGNSSDITFKIHIVHINDRGELEDILKLITSNAPIMANCLEKWQECLAEKKLDYKELNKLWVQVYQKYDCCTKEEQENMKDNCNVSKLLEEKRIYDFNKDIKALNDLKDFLKQLSE